MIVTIFFTTEPKSMYVYSCIFILGFYEIQDTDSAFYL